MSSSRTERELIEAVAARVAASADVLVGIGDDTAVLPFDADRDLLFTTDLLVEDVLENRQVALKLLPAAFASDAERAARFAREARTLASLRAASGHCSSAVLACRNRL